MRSPRRHTKPRNRNLPPPGKAERKWSRKAGEPEWQDGPLAGGSLLALDAKLAAIDMETALAWPSKALYFK